MKNKHCIALLSLVFTPGCMQITQKPIIRNYTASKISSYEPLETSIDSQNSQESVPAVTIWVHGTRLLPEGIFERYFYSKPGLNHYTSIESKYHQRRLMEALCRVDPQQYPAEHLYLFGWNGKLSFKERELAARRLYNDLKELRAIYQKKYGCQPRIRMLAHSHGGNVVLLLAQVKDPEDTSFFIDSIILMGTPVQKQTKQYACAECFGKVYSLYSMLDVLQVIDPQGLQQKDTQALFSERFFPAHENVEQIGIKINNRSIMHIEFVKTKFIAQIPSILNEVESWRISSNLCAYDWARKDKCLCINTKKSVA